MRVRRRELGEPLDEVFVPQVHEPGIEAEVDCGEAEVVSAGQRRKLHLFLMRACYSGAAFVMAFERETQQAFLEGHVEAFRFFGGVFALIRYDHLRAAGAQKYGVRNVLPSGHDPAVAAVYTYEVRCRGEIVSTGTLLLDARPHPGDTIELGALSGTVEEVIALTDETRLIVDSSEPR